MVRHLVKRTPIVRDIARFMLRVLTPYLQARFDSAAYWERRYKRGSDSGAGSYNRLARFKAEIINAFVHEHGIRSVIEFGSGDGAQLRLAEYPSYVGVDVSRTVLRATKERFKRDPTKRFLHADEISTSDTAELSLSLDVVYHLIEYAAFERHLQQVFDAAIRFVIVYSSNSDCTSDSAHVKHREFTEWVERNRPGFRLIRHTPNRYPEDLRDPDNTSHADFFFFERVNQM